MLLLKIIFKQDSLIKSGLCLPFSLSELLLFKFEYFVGPEVSSERNVGINPGIFADKRARIEDYIAAYLGAVTYNCPELGHLGVNWVLFSKSYIDGLAI